MENQQVWCTSELESVVLVSYCECPGVSVVLVSYCECPGVSVVLVSYCECPGVSVVLVSYCECPGVPVIQRNNSHNCFGAVIPMCLLIDICFYYQSKHNTLNIMHS